MPQSSDSPSTALMRFDQPTQDLIVALGRRDEAVIVDGVFRALEAPKPSDGGTPSSSPILTVLKQLFPKEFAQVETAVSGILSAMSFVPPDQQDGLKSSARAQITTFVQPRLPQLGLVAGLLVDSDRAVSSFSQALVAVPAMITATPLTPSAGELSQLRDFRDTVETARDRLDRVMAGIDNALVLDALDRYKEGFYAGPGSIGKEPVQEPRNLSDTKKGYYWIDKNTGRLVIAAASHLMGFLETRLTSYLGGKYEIIFDKVDTHTLVNAGAYGLGTTGYMPPPENVFHLSVSLKKK